jgi:hypothetical protein
MAMASLMPAIMTRTARPAGTSLEALAGATASAAAFRTTAATVGATSTAVWTATAIIAAAIPPTAAEGALKTLARIAANARGVARKFFARRGCAGACAARGAGFSRQEDNIVLGSVRRSGGGNEIVDGNISGVGALGFFLAVGSFVMPFIVMLFVMFSTRSMFLFVKSKRGMMFGALVSGISFGFRTIGRAAFFDLGGFVVGELRNFGGTRFFCFVFRITFGFAFRLVFLYFLDFLNFFLFFKNRPAGDSVSLHDFSHFFLLGFHEAGRERRDLIFI